MKVPDICKIAQDCDKIRNVLKQNERELTDFEIQQICYRFMGLSNRNFGQGS